MAADDLATTVAQYLQRHHVMTLATCGAGGPWAAAVFYVSVGPVLYFLSSPTSRHCRDLAANPRCAATVQQDTGEWQRIQGVQLEGLAVELPGDEERLARLHYARKFPLVGQPEHAPAPIAAALAKVRWYRLQPTQLHFIDNSRGFGQREAVALDRWP